MVKLRLSDFDYSLPPELIAQYPASKRDGSRLLVLNRKAKQITHTKFSSILEYFNSGDCLILNNTKVFCARLRGKRKVLSYGGGGKQEIFFLEKLSRCTYLVLAKPARKLTVGSEVFFDESSFSAKVLKSEGMIKTIRFPKSSLTDEIWQRLGEVPLPPYIKRKPEALDKERYQTVYAQKEGSAAAPTAGLHFTKEMLQALEDKGVNIGYLTLHVSYGTFAPVKVEDITQHKMHKEEFTLPAKTAKLICETKKNNKRVIAVGTTSVRVMEAVAQNSTAYLDNPKQRHGRTDLFIYPPYKFKSVDVLLTNFHFPKSTLLMMVSAFSGKKLLFKSYCEAIKNKYRFFSYGDAMLII